MNHQASPATQLLFAICLGIGTSVHGQESVEWSEPVKLEEEDEEANVSEILLPQGESINIEVTKKGLNGCRIRLERLSAKGKVLRRENFRFKGIAFYIGRFKLGATEYFFIEEQEKHQRLINAYLFNPEDLSISKVPIRLAEVSTQLVGGWNQKMMYVANLERNECYVIEKHPIRSKSKGDTIRWTLKTFDDHLNLRLKKDIVLNLQASRFGLNTFQVDEFDNLVMTCTYYDKVPKVFGAAPPNTTVFCVLPKNSETVTLIPVELETGKAHHLRYTVADQKISGYGLVSGAKTDRASGVFSVTGGLNGDILKAPVVHDFPTAITARADRRSTSKKDDLNEVPNFKVLDFRHRNDGGSQYILEQTNNTAYSNFTQTAPTWGYVHTGTFYRYDDIMVLTTYDDPKRDWYTLIRKRQTARDDDRHISFSSYYTADQDLLILYNDLSSNQDNGPDEEPDNLQTKKKMVTMLATITSDGKLSQQLLFSADETGHYFVPRSTIYNSGVATLYTDSKKTYRIGKLKLPAGK